jgi:hypothetical protein
MTIVCTIQYLPHYDTFTAEDCVICKLCLGNICGHTGVNIVTDVNGLVLI